MLTVDRGAMVINSLRLARRLGVNKAMLEWLAELPVVQHRALGPVGLFGPLRNGPVADRPVEIPRRDPD
jgi:hypothetical protein